MAKEIIKLKWELGYRLPGEPELEKWTSAGVPGAVQLDVAKAEGYKPWFKGDNWKDYLWMEDCSFIYRGSFDKPDLGLGEKLYFISKGIDYTFTISINGQELLQQEGMFTPVKLGLDEFLEEKNEILVKIFPVPKKQAEPADLRQASSSVKPAVSYGWDWHPRLIPSGIWDETFLEILPSSHLEDVSLQYVLNDDLSVANLEVEATGQSLEDCKLEFKLFDPEGAVVYQQQVAPGEAGKKFTFSLHNPKLWWPHDHGTPFLYQYAVTLHNARGNRLQTLAGTCGFRRVKLLMNQGGWENPSEFPKTRSVAPIQMEINGRQIFCKGSNWVNPEVFPGIISSDQYEKLTDRALEANFNIFRIWGGAIVNKQAFHELCDQKGIMVWQEFPLACNNYESTPEYLRVLEQESASIIKRIRSFPSLVMWSGGNELFNEWSGMTDQSLAIRLLNSQCLALDPHTPFISTSPLYGMGHGHYVFRDSDSGEEVYSLMNSARNTAYTEFGMPSPSSVEILESFLPEDELWPPVPGGVWESHHAYNAWIKDTWLMQDMIEDYFGKSKNLEELVNHGQLLQCEGYKAIYEEARRQKPYCSMALNWCYNEPWPTAANNNLISFNGDLKPAFWSVSKSCQPILASARNFKFVWQEGELFRTELWMLNDQYEKLDPGIIRAKLISGKEVIELGEWRHEGAEKNTNLQGPCLELVLPSLNADRFNLEIEVEGHPDYNSSYLFLYRALA